MYILARKFKVISFWLLKKRLKIGQFLETKELEIGPLKTDKWSQIKTKKDDLSHQFLAALSLCIQGFLFHFSDGPKMTTISQAAKSCDLYLSTFMKPLCAPQCLIKCNFLIHLALRSLNASRVPLSNFLKLTNWLEFAHMKDWMDIRSLLHTE